MFSPAGYFIGFPYEISGLEPKMLKSGIEVYIDGLDRKCSLFVLSVHFLGVIYAQLQIILVIV